ncbi:MAG TPA: VOC family protein [Ilumatobacteraceae bacterium]|nr:VOC family protein [Ilumatobacteraceae bacterium]
MSLHVSAITFDCSDAAALAEFWSAALDRPIEREGDMAASEFFAMIPGDGASPTMMFIQVPEGKTAKNRVHLDLGAVDRAAEAERLVGLGAVALYEKNEFGFTWTTLTDPEGNEFCIATH